ncbi:hypothetical protein [Streptomyces longwoodensis]|uniref:hypothetical protein n=1 Tax=Streptomyces longwoodensis TaxID=68231 RepID=UPI00131B93F4|nr:hypothetical protein [Streptomyces longwoodensis]
MADEIRAPEELALSYAKEWAQLPPAHLRVALKQLEPMMVRQHELMVARDRRRHVLDMIALCGGTLISVCSVAAAFYFGLENDYVMAGIMVSPSVLAMAKLLVLRQSDAKDSRAAGAALNAATQLPPPP